MLLADATGGIPGNAAFADVDPTVTRVGDVAGVAAAGLTVGGTATFSRADRCASLPPLPPLAQPIARTATVDARVAPVMESRCQRLSRYAGLDT